MGPTQPYRSRHRPWDPPSSIFNNSSQHCHCSISFSSNQNMIKTQYQITVLCAISSVHHNNNGNNIWQKILRTSNLRLPDSVVIFYLHKGDRWCTTFAIFGCRKAMIELGKRQLRLFNLTSPPGSELQEIPADFDLERPEAFFSILSDLKNDQNDDFLLFSGGRGGRLSPDLGRRKWKAEDLDRQRAGSAPMIRDTGPKAKAEEQAQGLRLAQSGQRRTRRFLRQVGQTPLCGWEGCFRHFQFSSSSSSGRGNSIVRKASSQIEIWKWAFGGNWKSASCCRSAFF